MKPDQPITLRLVVRALLRKLWRCMMRHKPVTFAVGGALLLMLAYRLKPDTSAGEAAAGKVQCESQAWNFDDYQPLHADAALRYGIEPIADRAEADSMTAGLVEIEDTEDYHLATLTHSIPYLTPHAALLLDDIANGFRTAVQKRGYRAPRLVVTSVLRTRHDVGRLQRHNVNATENSAHMYATTFDISYRRFEDTDEPGATPHDTVLQNAFREILRTLHDRRRCYVKKEKKQPCYHITVRE